MPGRGCTICLDKRRATIERGCDDQSIEWAASKYNLSVKTLKKHRAHCEQLANNKLAKENSEPSTSPEPEPLKIPPPEFPKLADTATELERVTAQCQWLVARIEHEQATENDAKNLAQLSNALTGAQKHQSALSGSKVITMHQVLASAHWLTIKGAIVKALAENKEGLNAVIAALQELGGDAEGA
jgi:hypothetical protein